MVSQYHPRLVAWFDEGLAAGRFKVPNGRHIVLNEFPRMMRETRLRASAGVDPESLKKFLLALNPRVRSVVDGSPEGLRRHLMTEVESLPALRKVHVPLASAQVHETVFVYTPPLETMRQGWRAYGASLAERGSAGQRAGEPRGVPLGGMLSGSL